MSTNDGTQKQNTVEVENHHCSKCGWERLLWRPQDKCAHVLICPLCLMTRPHSSQECDKYTGIRIEKLEVQVEVYRKALEVNANRDHGFRCTYAAGKYSGTVPKCTCGKAEAMEALSAQGEQGTDQKLLDDAVDCIRAFMYRFHPAGQSLEPEGPKINLEKTFEIAINILSRYINLNAPTAQEPPTETQERCPKLVKIKDGWENAGEILKQLGEPVLVGGQLWTPVLMPDEEDPEFFKSSGLVPVTESKEGRGE